MPPLPRIEHADLPEHMTWDDLERLPEEIAAQIELWEGRVVWVRRGPAEHQDAMFSMTGALKRAAHTASSVSPEQCWRAALETNVFLGSSGKSDFLTPDFLVYRCPKRPFDDVRADDVALVGEVLSPSNTPNEVETKKTRYAGAGIPWYWEVALSRSTGAIDLVRAYALESEPGRLPEGVRPLREANYLLAGEWSPADAADITIDFPFSIRIPWSELNAES
ncbi:Uma2 family endonuclease [Nocardia halotolerans]|uniref:Uma2 family endonuclease n=1 Tax=Nocardia halotolerans TaxID=1755878 RepID=A0ABV8VB17_9NOCA